MKLSRSLYLREILNFLKHCKVSRSAATVGLAKEYLAWREQQFSGPAREALRWRSRRGRGLGPGVAVRQIRAIPSCPFPPGVATPSARAPCEVWALWLGSLTLSFPSHPLMGKWAA